MLNDRPTPGLSARLIDSVSTDDYSVAPVPRNCWARGCSPWGGRCLRDRLAMSAVGSVLLASPPSVRRLKSFPLKAGIFEDAIAWPRASSPTAVSSAAMTAWPKR